MNSKKTQIIVIVGVIAFVILILYWGWISSKKVREVVTDNFNQQQLILARNAAIQIKHNVESVKNQLNALSSSLYIFKDRDTLSNIMEIVFVNIEDKGGIQIKYIDRDKMLTYISNSKGFVNRKANTRDINFLNDLNIDYQSIEVYISDIYIEKINDHERPIIHFVQPVKHIKSNVKDTYSGYLIFTLDAYTFISKVTKDIVSGQTGYAFVIDQKNIFLYHHELEFIAKDSTLVRREKNPQIPFSRINDIQDNQMLKGKEGIDWYISGWHRGAVGEMKKLIAFTPIHLDDRGYKMWSIAVVAPISEVEDAIHSIQLRQFAFQLLFILGTLLFGLLNIHMLINWSDTLQQEVDKKTLEFKLSEEKYKSLVENADDIIFTLDDFGRYLSMNKYGLKFFNKKLDEIINHKVEDIIPDPFDKVINTMMVDVFTNKESVKFTHFIKIGDNEYWLNTNMRRLYDAAGKTYAVLGISRDITATKKKEMEEQMYHTEKLASMGVLAAGVAHEINNPLAIILGFSDLLLEQTPPDSSQYAMLKTIEKHALNAKRVVEGLLSFARYSEQKEDVCDINKNLETVLSVLKNTFLLNNIIVKKDLQDDLPSTNADPGKLQQVFLNLINNAIHAMKDGGTLSISTKKVGDENIEIRFSDTGHGIAPEYRNKIFDPLFTTKKVGEGTGLGLSVCYGIITQHGGKITFETKTKEESATPGTTFIITLPFAKQ